LICLFNSKRSLHAESCVFQLIYVIGVGSKALEEQSKGGAEQGRKPRETMGFRMAAYSRHSHNNKTIPPWRHTTMRFSILLVIDSSIMQFDKYYTSRSASLPETVPSAVGKPGVTL
jgi:hypothetical protein